MNMFLMYMDTDFLFHPILDFTVSGVTHSFRANMVDTDFIQFLK